MTQHDAEPTADRDEWSEVTHAPGGWRAWSDVTRSDDRWSDDPVGWAMPLVCARHLRRAAAWMGAVAALGGALACLLLVVTLWLLQASTSGSPSSAMRAGILLFLGAQHGGVTIAGDTVRFLPLGLLALAAVLPWRAGRALAALADDRGQRAELRPAFARLVGWYVGAVVVLAAVGRVGTSHAEFLTTVLAAAVLVAVVGGAAVRTELRGRDDLPFLPARWRDPARAAGAALLVSAASSALLVAGSLVWHGGRVVDLSAAVGGGLSGVPVLLVGVVSAPNAVVATMSLVAGPGFAVGTDTVVRLWGSQSGLLPAVPLLGALPGDGGAHPVVVTWAALTFVAVGFAVARTLGRSRSVVDALRRYAGAAALAGLAMAAGAWLAGGGLGSGTLHAVGASPWQAGLAVAGQVALAGFVVAGTRALVRVVRVDDDEIVDVAPVAVVDTVAPAVTVAPVATAVVVEDDTLTTVELLDEDATEAVVEEGTDTDTDPDTAPDADDDEDEGFARGA